MNKTDKILKKFLSTPGTIGLYFAPNSKVALRHLYRPLEILGDVLTARATIQIFEHLFEKDASIAFSTERRLSQDIPLENTITHIEALNLGSEGIAITIVKKEAHRTQVDEYPQVISSFFSSNSGLVIGVHQKEIELCHIERDLFCKRLNKTARTGLYIRSKSESPVIHNHSFILNVEDSKKGELSSFKEEIDTVRWGVISSIQDLKYVLDLVSSGAFVMANIRSSNVREALVYLQSYVERWEDQFRLGRALIGFYSFLSWVNNNQYNYAFEAYPLSSEGRLKFCTLKSEEFQDYFQKDFKTNGLGFSQSLHTQLLKRSIDFRRAFELAPDPEELDYILKKSGL